MSWTQKWPPAVWDAAEYRWEDLCVPTSLSLLQNDSGFFVALLEIKTARKTCRYEIKCSCFSDLRSTTISKPKMYFCCTKHNLSADKLTRSSFCFFKEVFWGQSKSIRAEIKSFYWFHFWKLLLFFFFPSLNIRLCTAYCVQWEKHLGPKTPKYTIIVLMHPD